MYLAYGVFAGSVQVCLHFLDGSCDTFSKRDNIEKVMRGESQFIKPFVLVPCKIRISLDSGGLAGALDSQIL